MVVGWSPHEHYLLLNLWQKRGVKVMCMSTSDQVQLA
jgi:hypothetical protein